MLVEFKKRFGIISQFIVKLFSVSVYQCDTWADIDLVLKQHQLMVFVFGHLGVRSTMFTS